MFSPVLGRCRILGRDLLQNPKIFVRTLHVLSFLHNLLIQDKMCSQRDVYYQLIALFSSPEECYRDIEHIAKMLRLSRISLNVYAASRGFVVGQLQLQDGSSGQWIDLSCIGRDGRPIPGDMSDLCRPIQSRARFVLVIEKEGIYQELSDARFFNQFPCIMVTAHGVPDVATRAFVCRLSKELAIPVYGLADWNPGGVQVMLSYCRGGASKAESSLYQLQKGSFFWLGLLWEDVSSLKLTAVPLTHHDMARTNNLRSAKHKGGLEIQLMLMEQNNVRAELQAVRDVTSMVEFVTNKILKRSMIEF